MEKFPDAMSADLISFLERHLCFYCRGVRRPQKVIECVPFLEHLPTRKEPSIMIGDREMGEVMYRSDGDGTIWSEDGRWQYMKDIVADDKEIMEFMNKGWITMSKYYGEDDDVRLRDLKRSYEDFMKFEGGV